MGLSENRSKDKWSKDPRGMAWSKDESRFGFRMLESMGWSKGTGLGKTNKGAKTHVKVKTKSNFLGVGAGEDNDYNWLKTQDDFTDVLSALNHDAVEGDGKSAPAPKKSVQRKRLLYSRFKQSKDMSAYSKEDLSCIIGTTTDKPTAKPLNHDLYGNNTLNEDESSDSASDNEAKADTDKDSNTGVLTITKKVSVADYFSARLAAKNNPSSSSTTSLSNGKRTANSNSRSSSSEDNVKQEDDIDNDEEGEEVLSSKRPKLVDEEKSKKKKKKSKKKKLCKEEEEVDTEMKKTEDETGQNVDEKCTKKKNKKNKSKSKKNKQEKTMSLKDEEETEANNISPTSTQNKSKRNKSKKSKSKKKNNN
eukprot:m.34713 g.34713  ORF g.34713 m.34713 type:complete len:363 (-) comp9943_c0_seq1:111-1199(-)